MTTAAAKVRYQHNDRETYVDVLSRIEPHTCAIDGISLDPVLFKVACLEATQAVPLNDAPAGAYNRERYVRERLADAVAYRNRWYRLNLPAEGRA